MTNAVVVATANGSGGGKQQPHGVGAGKNKHNYNNHYNGKATAEDVNAGQLETNPLTRLRSTDSFR